VVETREGMARGSGGTDGGRERRKGGREEMVPVRWDGETRTPRIQPSTQTYPD